MPLPKLDIPTYDVTLPSGIRVTYRSFLVKEEKLFLVASQSDDADTIVSTLKQILSNCIVCGPPIDELPLFDIEYLLIQIRARSVGEKITVRYRCKNIVANTSCNTVSDYEVDLLEYKPTVDPNHTKTIMLTDKIGVVMRYPLFKTFSKALVETIDTDNAIDLILNCIESIFDAQTVHYTKDVSKEELYSFIETLTPQQLETLDRFFDTLPRNEIMIQFHCPKCQHEEPIEVKGIDNFFV